MPYAANGQISTDPIPGGITITNAQYQAALDGIAEGMVVSIEGGFSVAFPPPPPEPEPEPQPEPDPLDRPLTRRQVRAALTLAGFPRSAIPDAIEQIADPMQRDLAMIDWEDAPDYRRSHPLFNDPALMAALGLNAEAIDSMWANALSLPA